MKHWRVVLLLITLGSLAWAQSKNQNDIVLETTIIPEISFKDASLSSVLEYFSKKAGDKQPLNFVPLYPPEYGDKPITLQLANVPLKVALEYIGELANVDFIPDRHAIRVVVKPPKARIEP